MQAGMRFLPYKLFVGLFIPDVIAKYDDLQLSSKVVWGKLAQHAGQGGDCYPGIDTVAAGLGCSVRTVQRCIKELTDKRFIEVEACFNKKIQTTNQYYFLWHPIFDSALMRKQQGPDGMTKCHPENVKKSPQGMTFCHPQNGDKKSPKENQISFEEDQKKTTTTSFLSSEVLGWIDQIAPCKDDPESWRAKMIILGRAGRLDLDLLEKQASKVSSGNCENKHASLLTSMVLSGKGDDLLDFLDSAGSEMVTIGNLCFDRAIARKMVAEIIAGRAA